MPLAGVEPTTFGLLDRRSNRLSYKGSEGKAPNVGGRTQHFVVVGECSCRKKKQAMFRQLFFGEEKSFIFIVGVCRVVNTEMLI